jgi:hypothetical protein
LSDERLAERTLGALASELEVDFDHPRGVAKNCHGWTWKLGEAMRVGKV